MVCNGYFYVVWLSFLAAIMSAAPMRSLARISILLACLAFGHLLVAKSKALPLIEIDSGSRS